MPPIPTYDPATDPIPASFDPATQPASLKQLSTLKKIKEDAKILTPQWKEILSFFDVTSAKRLLYPQAMQLITVLTEAIHRGISPIEILNNETRTIIIPPEKTEQIESDEKSPQDTPPAPAVTLEPEPSPEPGPPADDAKKNESEERPPLQERPGDTTAITDDQKNTIRQLRGKFTNEQYGKMLTVFKAKSALELTEMEAKNLINVMTHTDPTGPRSYQKL
ncbi:MAG: hypothetical protein HQK59_01755 [Deltaproteobacteria bacterium]|nr:hypothetical protein [Deltaproteobacteria bacterium]